ncbi:MAG: hypothetical protein QHC40_09610 [Sphingobium sp.]|nr:hypothetical protein [Sphingobium sp.]
MRKFALLALAGALALSACGKKEEAPDVEPTNNLVAPPDDSVMNADQAEPEPEVTNNVAQPAPPPEISEDQQMLDDAAASGMTARLREGGDGEPVEEKGEANQNDAASQMATDPS